MSNTSGDELIKLTQRPKKQQRWMVTFADMMMLLLCFFILLFSFSNTNEQRFKQVSYSFAKAFGIETQRSPILIEANSSIVHLESGDALLNSRRFQPGMGNTQDLGNPSDKEKSPLQKLQQKLEKVIHLKALGNKVIVQGNSDLLTIRLQEQATFASGSGYLQPKGAEVIRAIAPFLAEFPGRIEVTGHTDNTAIVNDMYSNNVELSIARASAVAKVISSAIPQRTISISGKGESEPVASNNSKTGRAQNRRVEILVFQGKSESGHLPQVLNHGSTKP